MEARGDVGSSASWEGSSPLRIEGENPPSQGERRILETGIGVGGLPPEVAGRLCPRPRLDGPAEKDHCEEHHGLLQEAAGRDPRK